MLPEAFARSTKQSGSSFQLVLTRVLDVSLRCGGRRWRPQQAAREPYKEIETRAGQRGTDLIVHAEADAAPTRILLIYII